MEIVWLDDDIGIVNAYEEKNTFYEIVPANRYLQGGLIASPNKNFWDMYYEASLKHSDNLWLKENDVLNLIAYLLSWKLCILDGNYDWHNANFKHYYGCASIAREQLFTVDNDKIVLENKQVKLYHYARGPVKPYRTELFTKEVNNLIDSF